MEDLVSVIVPVYNVEKYLNKCINSITNQTYKNIEIIIVDDGSTDNSSQLCDILAETDDRIMVFHKKNGGLSDARNYGINVAKGKYLLFIDSDDYIDSMMIEKLYKITIKNECDITVCNYYLVDEKSGKLKIRSKLKKQEVITTEDKYNYLYNEYKMLTVIACNKIYKREIFENIRFPKGKLNEDEIVILDILKKAKKIVFINECLYFYVQRNNSIMHSFNMRRFEILNTIRERENIFLEMNDTENYMQTNLLEYILTLNLLAGFYKFNNHDASFEKQVYSRLNVLQRILKRYKFKNIIIKDKIRLLFPKTYLILKSKKIIIKSR